MANDFSVLMSIYKNSKIKEVKECLESLFKQTVKSNDIVIVIDGYISPELSNWLDEISKEHTEIKLYALTENVGLGDALKFGMPKCKNELIARMDTDDIAEETRFYKQLKCFENDTALSIVGSDIAEFIDNKENVVSYRAVPTEHNDIYEFMKKRCPFNHMTVMFKKSEVEKAGGYIDFFLNEDSYLWVRMYLAGAKFGNIDENLVFVRIDENTFKRRGGYKYYKSEIKLFKFMKQKKIIGNLSFFSSWLKRFLVYIIMPNRMRQWAFKKFVRRTK